MWATRRDSARVLQGVCKDLGFATSRVQGLRLGLVKFD